ncbi:hypothetical protein [Cupriavidus malaysiensis]|uniref:DUF3077 domain-containing protein n=1 Tax=Cupriavidus malaysiensis TaxID=367825 RepID=A0ABN4TMF5_9BURK|nr:hypothetical protein [Cupriavidus malaysiensis]AOZ07691.1 hypothetical protein BKK80_19030 [Cupriavidus malaysiensis]
MLKHTRSNLTAEQGPSAIFLTRHFALETPLSVAAEKAAQLHGLLYLLRDCATGDGAFETLARELQDGILSLAADLAHETLVMSEMAVLQAGTDADRT